MKIGISTACLYPELLENALKSILERGVDVLEIFINTHSELNKNYLKNLKAMSDNYGAEIVSLHPFTCGIEPMMFFTPYQRRFDDILEYYKLYFEAMNILGAGIFVFHGNNKLNTYPDENYFERYLSLFNLGRQFGITVAHENVERCTGGNLSFLLKMSEALGDSAKFVLDLKQARRSGENPNEFIKVLKNNIVHIHYSDGGSNEDCVKFGKGEFDNTTFIDNLRQNNYKNAIILELYRENFIDADDLIGNFKLMKNILTQ